MTYTYVPFVSDTAMNQEELRKDLIVMRPDWVGAVPKGNKLDELQEQLPDKSCYVSSAELYPDGSANVFVRVSPDVPAIGFIRVRP